MKIKRIVSEELVVCGYCLKRPMNELILGQYKNGRLTYRGKVNFGVKLAFLGAYNCQPLSCSPFTMSRDHNDVGERGIIWIEPKLVCRVEYMPNIQGYLRQPVFKGIVGTLQSGVITD